VIVFITSISSLAMCIYAYNIRYVLGIDTISYISIAEHYLNGRWQYAINAYWSPMVSWLMTPFISVGFTGSEAFLAVNVIASVLVLILGIILIRKITKSSFWLEVLYLLSLSPFLLRNLSSLMPDM